MQCKKISLVLNKDELNRLKEILRLESSKLKNTKFSIFNFIDDVGDITFYKYYLDILYFIKYYKKSIDNSIKKKLLGECKNRSFDFDEYKEKVKQRFYMYTKNDYFKFLNRSEYFFSLYKNPLDIKNMRNEEYLNRTYLGLGFEFLLKAIFLRKGYIINQINIKGLKHPVKSGVVSIRNLLDTKTHVLGYFIDLLPKLKPNKVSMNDFNYYIMAGLFICQNWRNQDIHTPTELRNTDTKIEQYIKYSHDSLYEMFLHRIKIPKFPK